MLRTRALAAAGAGALLIAGVASAWVARAQEGSSSTPPTDTAAAAVATSQSSAHDTAIPRARPSQTLAPAIHTRRPDAPKPAATAPAQAMPAPMQVRLGARLAPGAPIPAAELEAFVDGAVRQSMLDDHIPGVAVSVVQNGQTVLKQGYGFASLDPARAVDPDSTLFRLGSISKTFTWIAIMKEVEHGRMRLDAPVNLYLPEKLQVRDQGYAEPVRLKDLMTHAPGFEDRTLGRLFERDPKEVRPLEVYLRQERPRRVLPPGQRSEFSNYGVGLAGEAVSQVTGKPFEDLMEAEILRPLGLNHTSFREPRPAQAGLPGPMSPAMAQGMATGFRWTGMALEARPFEYAGQLAPADSASSTAGDMARYMTMMLNGGTLDGVSLYGPQTAQAFETVLRRPAPDVNGWTHGLMQYHLPGGFEGFGHDGATLSFHSNLVTVPALNLGVFVAGNSETAGALAERLPALIVEHFYGTPPAPPPPRTEDPDGARQTYAGYYVSEARRYGGLEKFVSLLRQTAQVSVDHEGLLTIRWPQGGGIWAPSGSPGHFRSIVLDQRSAFELVDGRAVRWFAPSGAESFARADWFLQKPVLAALALAALVSSLAVLIGLFTRDRRDFRQTTVQSRASALQTTASVLWLTAMVAFALWVAGALADPANAFYHWPGAWILLASACALVAALSSALQVVMLPVVWRGGRRLDSWTTGRKLRFTATAAIFAAFALTLLLWGALEPWNS